MATFHVKGKAKLIVLVDEFGILHATEKCLCAMFHFHHRIVRVSKDDAYDVNNNVIKYVY
jgi:hypothetical protein